METFLKQPEGMDDNTFAFRTFVQAGGKPKDWWRAGHSFPLLAGADSPAHPLGPPTLSGTLITVDTMLQYPTRITRILADLTLQRFIMDRLFTSAGGVTGGAVVYDMAIVNEIYLTRDVEQVSPGAEFPLVTSARRAPNVALVQKWGGKTFITDEARDRNLSTFFGNELKKLGNTIVRKLNQRAMDVLAAAITANGGQSNFAGHNWQTVIVGGSTPTNVNALPGADFARAQLLADVAELGINYNLLLLNPQEAAQLSLIYADRLSLLLSSYGLSVYVSNRVPAGTGYLVAQGELGEIRIEKPLGTETWREPGTERTMVQASVRPVMYVTNPFAVMQITGLAG